MVIRVRTGTRRFRSTHLTPRATGLCRIEKWDDRAKSDDRDGQASDKLYFSSQRSGNSLVARWAAAKVAYEIKVFLFDPKGRLTEEFAVGTSAGGSLALGRRCFRYDDWDSVLLYVEPKFTKLCPHGAPDVRDDWMKVENGWRDRQRVLTRVDKNTANDE